MSRDWTPEELDQASEIMKASGHLSREEFNEALKLIKIAVVKAAGE